ncbi:MAG: SUMF1/EgtB/PvdO family nonheme iron enzyme [Anaerolineales bacterium]|nr:SUMF1/EgtB/PvdO family nonheme iron enzyme [Anaerolineales bacterium]
MSDLTIPKNLVEQLCKGNCVLFVGAGISMGKGGLPGGWQLAKELAERCDYPRDGLALDRVAQYHEDTIDRPSLLQYVCQRIREARHEPMETHQLIAALPLKIIVSTNYDCLIERALEAADIPYNVIVTDKQVSSWDERKVNLLKIHGCVTQWESIVITEDDYSEFFERRPNIANILSAEAARRTLLFVGHGLGDENLKRIYLQVTRNLAEYRHKSYAVQLYPNRADIVRWENKRLEIIDADATEFLRDLSEKVAAAMPVVEVKEEIPLPERPYKFLDYFEAADQVIFKGRELEAPALQRQIMAHKLTVLYGASGVGKTSLIQAGVIPRLHEDGYRAFCVRSLEDPAQAIKAEALRLIRDPEAQLDEEARATALHAYLSQVLPPETRLVVFLDQFEEFFIRLGDGVRRAFVEELAACLEDDALEMRAVISLRDDYFQRLDEFDERYPKIFDNRFRLRNLDEDKARLAIFLPAQQFGLSFEDELLRQLLADLESGGVEPAQLQIVCHKLYEDLANSGQPGTFTLDRYQKLGGTKAILAGYLDDVLEKLPEEEQELARGVLKSMVTGEETKAALSAREIAQDEIVRQLGLDEGTVGRILAELRDSRVVRKLTLARGESYELAHEVMVEKVWQWVTEAEARFKYARDMLRQDLNNFRNLGILMPLDRLEIVNLYRKEMSLSEEEQALLFRSALAVGYEVEYWRARADQAGLLEQLEDEWLIKLEGEATAAEAIVALGGIATPRLVERLTQMVEADFVEGVGRDVLHLTTSRQQRAVVALSKMTCPEANAALDRWTPESMVLIPAGPFTMGSTESGNEGPVHQVWLDAFWMARYPVTNAEYAEFVAASGYQGRKYWTEAGWEWKEQERRNQPREWGKLKSKRDHPVRYITWYEAVAYARWRGAMLPSEAQWEKAARGGLQIPNLQSPISNIQLIDNPNPERRYPWGDKFDKNKCTTSESRIGDTTPVGKYSPVGDSPYGVADMAGNVWEWTSSLYWPYPYSVEGGREDPDAPGRRVLRGGSFSYDLKLARCSSRHFGDPDFVWLDDGCRVGWCAAPALPLDSGF